MKPTPCDCPLSGWCERHKLHLFRHEHDLCRRDLRYFNLFASGTSPQHAREAVLKGRPLPEQQSEGLGDTVAWLIEKATFGRVRSCGGCKRRRRWLNRLFPYRRKAT